MLKYSLVVIAVMLTSGCSSIRGSVSLSPAVTDPKQGIWVYIESTTQSQTGVYRCVETDSPKPVCTKASW